MVARIVAIAVLVVAVIAVVLVVSDSDDDAYEVTAEFTNASQLVRGNEVTIGGTGVGTVKSIELADNGNALVRFSVADEFAPLPATTVAQVRSLSLASIANRQVQLTLPPDRDGETIPDGGTLDRSQTVSTVEIDQLFDTLDPETIADFKKVIQGSATIVRGGAAEQANEGIKYLNPFLSSSRRTFAELTRDTPALEQLIVSGSKLAGAVAERRADLAQLVGNLDRMMSAIARQRTALATSVAELPDFMRNFNTTAVNLRATLDDLDPLVDAAKPVAVRLGPFFANFRRAAAGLVPTVRDLDVVVSRPGADNDLVDLVRLQPRLAKIALGPVFANGARRQGAFPEATTALHDSLDELAFFRAYSPELTGWFDGFGHSGVTDANGGIGRIGTTFNTFPLSASNLPLIDLANITDPANAPFGAVTGSDLFDLGNFKRCPGSNERPAPDGSNPWTDGGTVDCDPSIVPPGN